MQKQIKQVAKKIFKSGFFHSIKTAQDYICFKNTNNVLFSFQVTNYPFKGAGLFRAGYVTEYTEYAPTYESEYQSYGYIEKAIFAPFFEQHTDNPDYIKRTAEQITIF